MQHSPYISIILPTYNRQELLEFCIGSILAQTLDEWECILIDDGSSEETLAYLKNLQKTNRRFRLIQKDATIARGAPASRNIGMDASTAELIVFLDSDDYITPDCLEGRLAAFEDEPEADFIISRTGTFRIEPGDISRYACYPEATVRNDVLRFFLFDQPWLTTGPTWRKDFIKRFKWNESLPAWQDWQFHLDVLLSKPNYTRLEATDSFWRTGSYDKIGNARNATPIQTRHLLDCYADLAFRAVGQGFLEKPHTHPAYFIAYAEFANHTTLPQFEEFRKSSTAWNKLGLGSTLGFWRRVLLAVLFIHAKWPASKINLHARFMKYIYSNYPGECQYWQWNRS